MLPAILRSTANAAKYSSFKLPLSAAPQLIKFYTTNPTNNKTPNESSPESSAADNADPSKPEIDWKSKFTAKDKEAAKLKEAYQKSVADFRNLQKTTEQTVEKSKQYALQKFAKDLIESVDNFDLAMQAFPKDKLATAPVDFQNFYNGVAMVQQVLEKTLSKHGIAKVHPLDEQFDPNEHEALFKIPHAEKEAGTIIHVDRTGFKLFDRVLRAPKVGIVQDKEDN